MQNNSPPFTLIIPGLPPITNLQFTNGIFHYDIVNPQNVQYITMVLISQLPDNTALSLHYSIPPYNSMIYVGAVTNARPTDTFSTGWGMDTNVCNLVAQNTIDPNTGQPISVTSIKICVKADTFQNLIELDKMMRQDSRKQYAKCVAQNLYNFMGSYSSDLTNVNASNSNNYLIVPQDFLNKWFLKFEDKFKKDPNFILKTTCE